ncbi:hypothetical protein Dimus_008004, partial [Dionaea muscipula]
MEVDKKVEFKRETILKIERTPTIWSEEYEVDPLKLIKDWGPEAEVDLETPRLISVVVKMQK